MDTSSFGGASVPDPIFDAARHEKALVHLRQMLRPSIEATVDAYMNCWQVPAEKRDELVRVGAQALGTALAHFTRHPEHDGLGIEYFTKYYIWWIRKAITDYLRAGDIR